MLHKIIRFSIYNKSIIVVFMLAWIGFGVYSLQKLPLDAIPDITNNQVVIATQSPNLSAVEMEQFVSYPIEIAMQNIQGMTNMRSVSQFGISLVTLEFSDDYDIYFLRSQVLERLQNIPIDPAFGKPQMLPITTGLGEIYQYVIRPKNPRDTSWTPMQLRTLQDWVVKKKLLGTKGVAEISSFGGYVKQYHVTIDPLRMRAAGATLAEVYKAVSESNNNTGASYIEKAGHNYFIRGIGLLRSPEELNDVVVKVNSGTPLLVRHIGRVEESYAIRYGAMTQNGHEAVGGIVMMLKGENSNEVVQNVKNRIAQDVTPTLPKGLEIAPFLDRKELIDSTIHTVSKNLIEGGLIVIFVLVLMLGHWQAGLIVASVIPLSMLFAISMMVLFGVSGNLMSLGAIDFGLIVDGAVIIVENVVVVLNRKLYPTRAQSVFEGASKMVQSSILGQFVILVVYFPLLVLSGIEGKTFHPMVLTVIFALLGALILSLTFVPMLSSILLRAEKENKPSFSEKIMTRIVQAYIPLLRAALHRRAWMLTSAGVLLAAAIYLFTKMGGEFIPQLDEGNYALEIRMRPGTSLDEMIHTSHIVANKIKKTFPDEVINCTGKIGTSEIPTDPMTIEEQDMVITMRPKDEWKKVHTRAEFESALESEVLAKIPGVFFSLQQPIAMRFNELMTGAKSDVIVKVRGTDLEKLAGLGNDIVRLVEKIDGAKDVVVAKAEGLPQLYVKFRREALMRYGLSMTEVNSTLQMAVAGKYATTYFVDNKRFDVLVKLDSKIKNSFDKIANIQVTTPMGVLIPLKEIATIDVENGPMAVFRAYGVRNVNVSLNVRGRDVESVVGDIQKQIQAQVTLPAGYDISYGGQFENLKNASRRLMIVVPLSLAIILLLLYFAFRSAKDMLIISTAIPFAAIGGVFALWLRDMPFSISAGVGFIALFGVAVLNGMVLISYFNELKKTHTLSLNVRITRGVGGRFRAVLMTAMVASMGFIPMAFGTGAGAEVQRPLATVVIGGLISSTLLTLLILPAMYKMAYMPKFRKVKL